MIGDVGPYNEEDEYDESCYDSEYDDGDCIGECKDCEFVQDCINDGHIEACEICDNRAECTHVGFVEVNDKDETCNVYEGRGKI